MLLFWALRFHIACCCTLRQFLAPAQLVYMVKLLVLGGVEHVNICLCLLALVLRIAELLCSILVLFLEILHHLLYCALLLLSVA